MLAIQGRALPFDGTDIVPLAFKTKLAGDYTIAIDHVDGLFSGNQEVYLLDNTTGTETNLKAGA
jgi:trimeric autotransporter adhesin